MFVSITTLPLLTDPPINLYFITTVHMYFCFSVFLHYFSSVFLHYHPLIIFAGLATFTQK